MLNKEEHVKEINFLTTLAGYVHWRLTGERVLGVGEAAGMFPIDPELGDFDSGMMEKFNDLTKYFDYNWTLKSILQAGIPFCPPEGDAGTGMVATNSVAEHTGNVSAGTSIFAMIVLEKSLSDYYKEIDMVTTPTGKPVAMVHCNNFTSDINAWVGL